MNKIFIAVILSAFAIFGNNFCSAAMAKNEMYLGGITFGTSTAQMLKMYGAPTRTEGGVEQLYACRYGRGVEISYNAYINKIFQVAVTENNGWHTPAGLAVGADFNKIFELYGAEDFSQSYSGKTVYAYFHSNGKRNDFAFVALVDDDNGKILRLEITGENPMVNLEDFFQSYVERLLGIEEQN